MAEDEIIKKHTKAVYKSWRDPEKSWKQKLKDILLEILIIVFAVTISIWFHNWSESINDRKAEKEFLKGLKYDIQADLKEMTGDREGLRTQLAGIHYFDRAAGGEKLLKDSLSKYSWVFFAQTQINPRIGRFEALKGSGKLDIIENKNLQYNIIDLYQKNFPQIFRLNQFTNTLMADKVDAFIGDNMVLDTKGSLTNGEKVLTSSKMRFLLMQCEGLRNNIDAYSQGIDKGKAIIKQIDDEIK